MNPIIKKDSIQILSEVISILKVKENKDVFEIKKLSNHTIHNASVFQDECSVSIAVIIYALSKVIERKQFELDYSKILRILEKARRALKYDELENFNIAMDQMFSEISQIDSRLKLYTREVINEAQIKKGCKLCEHGLSIGKASQVMGVSQWELMGYLGNTKVNESAESIVDASSRLKFARRLFS